MFFLIPKVPPSGGSLEIGNSCSSPYWGKLFKVPPSGGSLEIGNFWRKVVMVLPSNTVSSPFGGIPRNWKQDHPATIAATDFHERSPFGGIPRNWKLPDA